MLRPATKCLECLNGLHCKRIPRSGNNSLQSLFSACNLATRDQYWLWFTLLAMVSFSTVIHGILAWRQMLCINVLYLTSNCLFLAYLTSNKKTLQVGCPRHWRQINIPVNPGGIRGIEKCKLAIFEGWLAVFEGYFWDPSDTAWINWRYSRDLKKTPQIPPPTLAVFEG